MAVIGNTLSNIGDVIYIHSQGAVSGNLNLTGFTDVLIGETGTRFFVKTFRYSTDGVNYSTWLSLTNPNVALIVGTIPGLIFFEFRYERGGSDITGLLEFQSIQLNGNIIIQIHDNTTTLESIFQDLANNDALTAAIANNLLLKIYKSGILPKFIERGEGVDDTDFVSFWNAICYFLAYVSAFSNEFDNILYKRKYLIEYLKQRNIAFCEHTTTFSDLQFLSKNFYDEIRKRGTQLIYRHKSIDVNSLFLKFEGVNNSTIFLEETGKTVTPFGGAKISTDDYVSAPSSGLFNGTTDYLKTPYNLKDFDLSNCDFLIEADFNSNDFSGMQTIVSKDTYGLNNDWDLVIQNSNTIIFYTNQTIDSLIATVTQLEVNTWYNLKVIRQKGVNKIYLDGVLVAQNNMLITNASQVEITIGCNGWNNPHSFFSGYIDNLRIAKIDSYIMPIDGEWIRLLCRNNYDEFLVDVIQKEKNGFYVDNSSPLYNGTYFSKQINKTEENTEDFIDISKYDLLNESNVSIITDGSKKVIKIQGGLGKTGFGFDLSAAPFMVLHNQLIKISKEIDYEITFMIKRISGGTSNNLVFGVAGYNKNEVYKSSSFKRIDNNFINEIFYDDNIDKITKITDEWYLVRGIIYSADSQNITGQESQLNVNQGIKLSFNLNEDVDKLKICLYIDSNSSGDVIHIHDFKMRPLIRGKNIQPLFSGLEPQILNPQFIQGDGFILNWRRNNNQEMSDDDIQNFVEEFLLPYQKRLVQYILEPKIDDKQLLLDVN